MKKYFSQTQIFTFLIILLFGTACNGQVEKNLPKEKVSDEHPKLIKTIGNPRYGNVQCGLQDKAGNLWFGTTENGLYKYDGKSFTQFLVADGLNSNNVYSLLEDKDGKIWIGTRAGLCLYDARLNDADGQGKTFSEIQIPLPKNLPPNKNPNYRNAHWVYDIMQAKSGKLWFVTIDGVYIYDGKTFTPFEINEAASGFLTGNDKVERILEDKEGNIWFGGRTNKGVYRYDPRLHNEVGQGKSITHFKLEELNTYSPDSVRKGHSWAWPQVQDKDGNIWFSNWGGAYRYDGKSFTSFTEKDGLPDNMVARIIEDKKGTLWFGGGGLSRYNARLNDEVGQGKSFTRFTTKDGLPNLGVWEILEDKTGNVWVGTRETGLYLFDARLNDAVGQGKKIYYLFGI